MTPSYFSSVSPVAVASIAEGHDNVQYRAAAKAYLKSKTKAPSKKGAKTPKKTKANSGPLSFEEAIDKYGKVAAPVDPTLPPVSDPTNPLDDEPGSYDPSQPGIPNPKDIDQPIVEPIKDKDIIDDAT